MKHKVGDKVRIKSIDWYNRKKDEKGCVYVNDLCFGPEMSKLCGKEAIITQCDESDSTYRTNLHEFYWFNKRMFENYIEENPYYTIGMCEGEDNDLPIDTPVMVSEEGVCWSMRFYYKKNKAFINGLKSSNDDEVAAEQWDYIIPFSQFDPNNIKESLKHDIVPQKLKQ